MDYPRVGEFVIVKAKKVLKFGAIFSLEEYGGLEAFVHISEVSTGWVRNIRDHVKEGQFTVAKVTMVDPQKMQVDVSLKRASESEKKRKLQLFQTGKRARKMLEATGKKLGKPLALALQEAGKPLEEAYGDLWSAFEAMAAVPAEPLKAQIPKVWQDALTELAHKEIKQKRVVLKATLTLKSYASDGLDRIKAVLSELSKPPEGDQKLDIHYVSAPHYQVEVEAGDFKQAEKTIKRLQKTLDAKASGADFEKELVVVN